MHNLSVSFKECCIEHEIFHSRRSKERLILHPVIILSSVDAFRASILMSAWLMNSVHLARLARIKSYRKRLEKKNAPRNRKFYETSGLQQMFCPPVTLDTS